MLGNWTAQKLQPTVSVSSLHVSRLIPLLDKPQSMQWFVFCRSMSRIFSLAVIGNISASVVMSLRVREVAVPLISKVRNKHAYFKYL